MRAVLACMFVLALSGCSGNEAEREPRECDDICKTIAAGASFPRDGLIVSKARIHPFTDEHMNTSYDPHCIEYRSRFGTYDPDPDDDCWQVNFSFYNDDKKDDLLATATSFRALQGWERNTWHAFRLYDPCNAFTCAQIDLQGVKVEPETMASLGINVMVPRTACMEKIYFENGPDFPILEESIPRHALEDCQRNHAES